MFFSKMSVAQAIKSLMKMSHFGLGNEPTQSEMHKLISKVEKRFPDSDSYELEYRLGIALRNYTAWFVRGDERKPYLQEAVQHLEKAYALSKGVIPEELTATDEHTLGSLDRNTIVCDVGFLLIDEAIIRDLEKGISYLETIFNNTTDYYPQFCSYAEAFYKLGDYLKSAEVALELHRRAEKSSEWKGSVPPAPMGIVAKAYGQRRRNTRRTEKSDKQFPYFKSLSI